MWNGLKVAGWLKLSIYINLKKGLIVFNFWRFCILNILECVSQFSTNVRHFNILVACSNLDIKGFFYLLQFWVIKHRHYRILNFLNSSFSSFNLLFLALSLKNLGEAIPLLTAKWHSRTGIGLQALGDGTKGFESYNF